MTETDRTHPNRSGQEAPGGRINTGLRLVLGNPFCHAALTSQRTKIPAAPTAPVETRR